MPSISIEGLDEEVAAVMPPALAQVYLPLFKEVLWLSAKWAEYDTLYGSGKKTVDLLNRTAGYLFLIVQDTLWDDLLLHISRLTGPEKSMGKPNLTVKRLPALIDDAQLSDTVQALVGSCVDHCSFVKDHRNRRLAHHDLSMAVSDSEKTLTGVSRAQIRLAVDLLQEIVKTVYEHYTKTHFIFSMAHMHQSASSLLAVLTRYEWLMKQPGTMDALLDYVTGQNAGQVARGSGAE